MVFDNGSMIGTDSIDWHQNGSLLASAGSDGDIKIFDLRENRIIKVVDLPESRGKPERKNWKNVIDF